MWIVFIILSSPGLFSDAFLYMKVIKSALDSQRIQVDQIFQFVRAILFWSKDKSHGRNTG